MKYPKAPALGITLLLQLFIFAVSVLIESYAFTLLSLTSRLALSCATAILIFGFPTLAYLFLTKQRLKDLLKCNVISNDRTRNRRKLVLEFVLASALTVAAVNAIGNLTSFIMSLLGKEITSVIPSTAGESTLFFLRNVLLAAVLEELIFRGVILNACDGNSKIKRIMISASLFALMHCSLQQLPYAFVGGILIAYFALRSGSVLFAIGVHLSQNAVTFVFTMLQTKIEPTLLNTVSDATFIAFSVIGTLALCYFISDEIKVKKEASIKPVTDKKAESIFSLPLIAYVILTAVITAFTV